MKQKIDGCAFCGVLALCRDCLGTSTRLSIKCLESSDPFELKQNF